MDLFASRICINNHFLQLICLLLCACNFYSGIFFGSTEVMWLLGQDGWMDGINQTDISVLSL